MDKHKLTRPVPPVGLLLSEAVNQAHGKRFDDLAKRVGVPVQRYTINDVQGKTDRIHAAFFSRDLYEGSSLHEPGPLSNAFFQLVNNAAQLTWLHVCSAGLDLPQYQVAIKRGIRITSSSGSTAFPIAQTTLAAILALSRGFGHWLPAQARKEWVPLTGNDLPADIETQRVVIAGAGAIGQALGRMLLAVGFQVTLVRRVAKPIPAFDHIIDYSQLDHALSQCDWLVLALPLNEQTCGLINQRRLALMPAHARIANIGRGALIDESAMIHALSQGQLAGAYLDTFMTEPLPESSALWALPNVWITPHNSAASKGHARRVVSLFEREYERWLDEQQTRFTK
ncbi:D-2-hydroxyacid dehydrogenase [Advenella mimigardefordensis]|uniref:Putative NAD-binding D-isomer specific 2-hydroxyacid dehydrogenase n=1 Tax=Advenella mimigardefordensis (strain DSM 17166 / LMG 22922 / DPN7) TaxID=1247726 RepID=W0PD76_ADVMD|nr:D-2-hydroxyacid dehydrogenase [Advenella mimigardefordensis]AHG63370.1 putative NAD-binding D-isomer specific 2-hydroxyacid dehydrogenase [Advenella mimigardefordensis DPN7]